MGISAWLDTAALVGRHGLTEAIGDWGPWILRGLIVFITAYLVFGWASTRTFVSSHLFNTAVTPITWSTLGAHVLTLAAFAGLSSILFSVKTSVLLGNTLAVAWLTMGAIAVALAVTTFFPFKLCIDFIRAGGHAWISALGVSLAACLLGSVGGSFWSGWTDLTFRFVQTILRPILPMLTADPVHKVIGTAAFSVEVARGCSGIEGAALTLVFGIGWLWYFRSDFRFPNALLLVPAAMCVSWALNGFRVAALILIGNAGASSVALGGFHSQAGWIAFTAVALGMFTTAGRIRWVAAGPRSSPDAVPLQQNRSAAYLIPFLAILAAGMVSRAFNGTGAEWLYPLRFVAAGAALYSFRATYRKLDWHVTWLSPVAGAIVFALWIGLDSTTNSGDALRSSVNSWPAGLGIAWLAIRTIASIVTVPLAEELAFRAFLIRRLIAADFEALSPRTFTYVSVFISSLAFGLMHGDRWLPGIVAGLVYAGVFLRRGKIGDAVLAHATTNALIAIAVLARGHWGLW